MVKSVSGRLEMSALFTSNIFALFWSSNLSPVVPRLHASLVDIFPMLSDGKFNRIFCHRFGRHTRECESMKGDKIVLIEHPREKLSNYEYENFIIILCMT
jgi:hypothetical protein